MIDNEANDFLSKATHALVAVSVQEIITNSPKQHLLHIVAYHSPPTNVDVKELYEELFTDEELGLTHLVPKEDYMLLEYPWAYVRSILERSDLN